MSVSIRHVLHQGPVLASLVRTVASAAIARRRGNDTTTTPAVPGPWIQAELPPRPDDLVRDYIRHVGGDPGSYRGTVPGHLFPQWAFGLVAQTFAGLSYPLARGMNAGCRLELRAPLPAGQPLQVQVRLESVDDNGKRAILTQRVITGTRDVPEAVVADMRVFVPLPAPKTEGTDEPRKKRNGSDDKARPSVPATARELAFTRLPANAGLDFAKLTGDFNPIHWIPAAAHAAGFRSVILHGFGTLARAIEALNRRRFAGDVSQLAWVDARFVRPLVLPARVGVYVDDDALYVGDAPGGGAYLEGRFAPRNR